MVMTQDNGVFVVCMVTFEALADDGSQTALRRWAGVEAITHVESDVMTSLYRFMQNGSEHVPVTKDGPDMDTARAAGNLWVVAISPLPHRSIYSATHFLAVHR